MTEKETDQIAGKYARKRAEAKRRLACLKAKADQIAEELSDVVALLKEGGELRVDCRELHFKKYRPAVLVEPVPTTVTWPTHEEIYELLKNIGDTKRDIGALETKCQELGV